MLEHLSQFIVIVVGPFLPTSTSRPPDVIHVMNETKAFPVFVVSSAFVYYTEHKLKNKIDGGLGTRLLHTTLMTETWLTVSYQNVYHSVYYKSKPNLQDAHKNLQCLALQIYLS